MVLQVLCLTGEGLTFKIPGSMLGRDVHQIVSDQLPCKPGARLSMHLGSTRLMLHVPIQDQCTGPATLSCTYVPTNLYPRLYLSGRFLFHQVGSNPPIVRGVPLGTFFFDRGARDQGMQSPVSCRRRKILRTNLPWMASPSSTALRLGNICGTCQEHFEGSISMIDLVKAWTG